MSECQHYIEIEFDGFSPSVKLIHPESGCPPSEDRDECYLTDWLENEGADLLRGKLTLPVRWEAPSDRDHPLFHVLPPQPHQDTGDWPEVTVVQGVPGSASNFRRAFIDDSPGEGYTSRPDLYRVRRYIPAPEPEEGER